MAALFVHRLTIALMALFGGLEINAQHAQDCKATPSWFLDYGNAAEDTSITVDEQHFNLSRGYVVGSDTYTTLEVQPGLLYLWDSFERFIVLQVAYTPIKVDYYTPGSLNSSLYARTVELNDTDMTKISAIVQTSYGVKIEPTEAFIVTAVCLRLKIPDDDTPITYQVVVVGDENRTFAIYGYHSILDNIGTRVSLVDFLDGRDPVTNSNNCQPGRFVIELLSASNIRFLEPICESGDWSDKRCAVCGGCGKRIRKNYLSDGSFIRDNAPCPAKRCEYHTHSRREWRRSYRKPWKNIGAARRCCYHWRDPFNPKLLHRPKRCEASRVNGFA